MKAIVQERFGPPDVLQLVDIDLPEVGVDDVLVRVHAAALNPYDWHGERGAAPDSAVRRWGGQSTETRAALILAAIMALRGASFLRGHYIGGQT